MSSLPRSRLLAWVGLLTVLAYPLPAAAESDEELHKRIEFCMKSGNRHTLCKNYLADVKEAARRRAQRKQESERRMERQKETDRKASIEAELKTPSKWCVTFKGQLRCYDSPPQCTGLVPGTSDKLRIETPECQKLVAKLRQEKLQELQRGSDKDGTRTVQGVPRRGMGRFDWEPSPEEIANACGGGKESTFPCKAIRNYIAKKKEHQQQQRR